MVGVRVVPGGRPAGAETGDEHDDGTGEGGRAGGGGECGHDGLPLDGRRRCGALYDRMEPGPAGGSGPLPDLRWG
ncbi:hypothetical protein GCM10010103_12220 [Streptomyces paradoxus]